MGCGGAFGKRFAAAMTPTLQIIFKRLEMEQEEQKRWFEKFEEIDANHSGSIDVIEFFVRIDVDETDLSEHLFRIMNVRDNVWEKGKVMLDFTEFFCGIYHFCSLDKQGLLKMAYSMMDADDDGAVTIDELQNLLHRITPDKVLDARTQKMLQSFDKDMNNTIEFKEFVDLERKHQSMLFPAFTLQLEMRRALLGEKYWVEASLKRKLDIHAVLVRAYSVKKLEKSDVVSTAEAPKRIITI